jgi:hypothetical protein
MRSINANDEPLGAAFRVKLVYTCFEKTYCGIFVKGSPSGRHGNAKIVNRVADNLAEISKLVLTKPE